jgi:hypothetical protein
LWCQGSTSARAAASEAGPLDFGAGHDHRVSLGEKLAEDGQLDAGATPPSVNPPAIACDGWSLRLSESYADWFTF